MSETKGPAPTSVASSAVEADSSQHSGTLGNQDGGELKKNRTTHQKTAPSSSATSVSELTFALKSQRASELMDSAPTPPKKHVTAQAEHTKKIYIFSE